MLRGREFIEGDSIGDEYGPNVPSGSSADDPHVLRLDPDRVHVRVLVDDPPDVKLGPADEIASADLELATDGKLKHDRRREAGYDVRPMRALSRSTAGRCA